MYTIFERGVSMEIVISNHNAKPIYEQIYTQISQMIMNEELVSGDPLPSIRGLAKTLHISVITVQKAYEELLRAGLIETTVGRGTFVSQVNKEFLREKKQREIQDMLESVVNIAKENSIKKEILVDILSILFEEENDI